MPEKIDDIDLGLETPTEETAVEETSAVETSSEKAKSALDKAAAASAVAAAAEAQGALARNEADRTYIVEKKNFMLNKCKTDPKKKLVASKLYAQYFGSIYTYLFNGIPVTIKFDGTEQEFPEFIYDDIMEKLSVVADENVPKNIETKM